MSIQINELIELLARLSENKNIKAAFKGSVKGGAITGVTTIVGGLLLGPVGLAIGGILGGVGSALAATGGFRPVALILREMSPNERKKLVDNLVKAFANVGVKDVAALSLILLNNTSFQEMALRQLTNYLSKEMNMRIQIRDGNQ